MSLRDKDQEIEQLLFDILDEEPSVHVPYSFSSKVISQIRTRRNRVNDIKFYILISLIGIFGLGVAGMCLLLMDKSSAAILFDLIVAYKWVWLLALSGVFVIQYADQRVIVVLSDRRKNS